MSEPVVSLPNTLEEHVEMDSLYSELIAKEIEDLKIIASDSISQGELDAMNYIIQPEIIDLMVYSSDGGRIVDLTLEAIKIYASTRGGYTLELVSQEMIGEHIVVTFKVTDEIKNLTFFHVAKEKFDDEFGIQKAFSKGQRNALKMVIPRYIQLKVIEAYLKYKKVKEKEEKEMRLTDRIESLKEYINEKLAPYKPLINDAIKLRYLGDLESLKSSPSNVSEISRMLRTSPGQFFVDYLCKKIGLENIRIGEHAFDSQDLLFMTLQQMSSADQQSEIMRMYNLTNMKGGESNEG